MPKFAVLKCQFPRNAEDRQWSLHSLNMLAQNSKGRSI